MDWSDFGLKVVEILSPLLLAALTWASAKAAQLITAKVKNEYLKGALIRLDDAVTAAVKEVQQTFVGSLKDARADGKLTPEEVATAKRSALDAAKSYLGIKGLVELAAVFGLDEGTIDKLLGKRIEAAVHDLRAAEAPAVVS